MFTFFGSLWFVWLIFLIICLLAFAIKWLAPWLKRIGTAKKIYDYSSKAIKNHKDENMSLQDNAVDLGQNALEDAKKEVSGFFWDMGIAFVGFWGSILFAILLALSLLTNIVLMFWN